MSSLSQGSLAEAEHLLQGRRARLGDEHPDTLASMHGLAGLLGQAGKLAEAEPLLVEALRASRTTLGDEHLHTLSSMSNLAELLRRGTGPRSFCSPQ